MTNREGFSPTIEQSDGFTDIESKSELAPQEKPEVPEFMREAVEEAQSIIRTIEACRREEQMINEMFGRFMNEPDHFKASKQDILIPISKAKEAILLKVNELIQEARQSVIKYPQAIEHLTGPVDVLKELTLSKR